jgi:hypothetical protein
LSDGIGVGFLIRQHRNVPGYRDAAVIAISQLRELYVDAELELVDTANWFPRVMRKDYKLGLDVSTGGLDEPDQKFYENYVCGAERNLTGYCDRETDKLSTRNRWRPIRRSAGNWSGRSSAGWPRTPRDRCCCTPGLRAASAEAQGADDDDQQPLQWLAHGRRVAGQLIGL